MVFFYLISDQHLEKFAALHFKQEYGDFILLLALFVLVLGCLIILYYAWFYVKELIVRFLQRQQKRYGSIQFLRQMDHDCKEMIWGLLQTNRQKITPYEINEKNCILLEAGVFIQDRECFKIKDEDWQLIRKYQKKIFFESHFSNCSNTK